MRYFVDSSFCPLQRFSVNYYITESKHRDLELFYSEISIDTQQSIYSSHVDVSFS